MNNYIIILILILLFSFYFKKNIIEGFTEFKYDSTKLFYLPFTEYNEWTTNKDIYKENCQQQNDDLNNCLNDDIYNYNNTNFIC